MNTDSARAWRQLALSYVVTNGLVFVLSRKAPTEYGLHELIGALFLVAALVSVRRDDDDTRRYGIDLAGVFPGRTGDDRSLVRTLAEGVVPMARELAIAVGIAVVVFPIYALCWPWFNTVPAVRHFVLDGPRMQLIATNLFAVALTEEAYFRGYVQTRVADALGIPRELPTRERMLRMIVPVLVAAALFALTHVTVEVTLARAVVFFPALLFGVVRAWRGGVGAAIFLHAMSNVFENWLEGH